MSHSHWQQCGAERQFLLPLVDKLVPRMGAARREPSALLPLLERGFEKAPSHPSWFGSTKQSLLDEIILLFPSADATNHCSAMASAGVVTHLACLGTSSGARGHVSALSKGEGNGLLKLLRSVPQFRWSWTASCITLWKVSVEAKSFSFHFGNGGQRWQLPMSGSTWSIGRKTQTHCCTNWAVHISGDPADMSLSRAGSSSSSDCGVKVEERHPQGIFNRG